MDESIRISILNPEGWAGRFKFALFVVLSCLFRCVAGLFNRESILVLDVDSLNV